MAELSSQVGPVPTPSQTRAEPSAPSLPSSSAGETGTSSSSYAAVAAGEAATAAQTPIDQSSSLPPPENDSFETTSPPGYFDTSGTRSITYPPQPPPLTERDQRVEAYNRKFEGTSESWLVNHPFGILFCHFREAHFLSAKERPLILTCT